MTRDSVTSSQNPQGENQERKPVRRALIGVSDKAGLLELATSLHGAGVEIVSTGGTARTIAAAGVPVTPVEELTGFPEILDGRVKTLHPRVHAGLLADLRSPAHAEQIDELEIPPFDLLVVNLYPFAATVAGGAESEEVIENIDIGGPAMVRAAAKNHGSVAVVVEPSRYEWLTQRVQQGGFTLAERQELAAAAFAHTASYDVAVASWMSGKFSAESQASAQKSAADSGTESAVDSAGEAPFPSWMSGKFSAESQASAQETAADSGAESAVDSAGEAPFPSWMGQTWERRSTLRYGENPHQAAALYVHSGQPAGLAAAAQLHGKEMSYNNYVDADAAWRAAHDHADACVAIIKHANPCGIAAASTATSSAAENIAEAHRKAHACDPVSAFGGVIAANREVTVAMAEQVADVFTEVIVAPGYSAEALDVLTRKKNVRVLTAQPPKNGRVELRAISGGVLVQAADAIDAAGDDPSTWQLATGTPADENTLRDLAFAWRACRAVKSNAILLANDQATVGVGMGQVNRVDSARLAVQRSGDRASGSVAASDAFFPFADGLEVLLKAGIRAVVQPGGSVRDSEVIAAAQEAGVTMYLTQTRHFAH